ncbi:MAG: hypothetical protein FJX29_11295 [Alphaproteobacteria bacterium]|nr:hypothetical protein [Alphaproteobacteria bacterium]
MSSNTSPPAASDLDLASLRVDIDRIDLDMHELLMQRGQIIDKLIAIKERQGGGSAFRPGREAAMMRAFAERHRGILPLDTVEGIWRIIISTFTYVQANYAVHVDASGGDPAMRDSTRFHFGFTVPYCPHLSAIEVISAVASSGGDLGLIRIDPGIGGGPWWEMLRGADAPKVIARLPFIQRQNHPAGLPVFVISLPLHEAASREVVVYAVAVERWRHGIPAMLGEMGAQILGNAASGNGLSLLISAPGQVRADALAAGFETCDLPHCRIAEVGSHAAQYHV